MVGIRGVSNYPSYHFSLRARLLIFPPEAGHHLKSALIFPQDVLTYFPHNSTLYHLRPHFHVPELPALTEVVEEVHQTKLQQHTRDLLTAWVLGLDDVYVEVP